MKPFFVTVTPMVKNRKPYDCEVMAATKKEAIEFVRNSIAEPASIYARSINNRTSGRVRSEYWADYQPSPVQKWT